VYGSCNHVASSADSIQDIFRKGIYNLVSGLSVTRGHISTNGHSYEIEVDVSMCHAAMDGYLTATKLST
jgi:hypothetical protein